MIAIAIPNFLRYNSPTVGAYRQPPVRVDSLGAPFVCSLGGVAPFSCIPNVMPVEHTEVMEHLMKSVEWTATRSSGPGGQHRDKASTRAELSLTLEGLASLEPAIVEKLTVALGLREHPLRIVVQDERSLSRNKEIAVQRLSALVAEALAPPPRQRRPTRPSRASRERRLADKVRRGREKVLRRGPEGSD